MMLLRVIYFAGSPAGGRCTKVQKQHGRLVCEEFVVKSYFYFMKRSIFFKQLLLTGGAIASGQELMAAPFSSKPKKWLVPPSLKSGDAIGITCPSGFALQEDIAPAVQYLEKWGLHVVVGKTVGRKDHTFGGTDEERAADFQSMVANSELKAILCARGGYGAVRIIDKIDFSPLRRNPKWVIGYSDITVFHCHLHALVGMASIHAKMTEGFPSDPAVFEPTQLQALDTLRQALLGEKLTYSVPPNPRNRPGEVSGILVGGNLKILETLAGTPSDIDTRDKIFFVEDVGEALYSIDRMFCNLKRSGKLSQLKALIVGSFTNIRPDDPEEPFGRSIYDIVWEQVKEYDYPVCFDFCVGHQKNNVALKCGVQHRLQVSSEATTLTIVGS